MVSLSSVTVRLLPETRRGMYSVCDALGGERTGSEGPPHPSTDHLVPALCPEQRWTCRLPAGKHNTRGNSTADPALRQGRGLAGPQHPSRTTHPPGITSEIPAAGRFSWRGTRPSHCCTLAATGSRCWSRRGARTPRMRSALWDGAGGSGVLSAPGIPSFSPSQLPVPHHSPARRSSGSSRQHHRSARRCPCSSPRAPCTRCLSATART